MDASMVSSVDEAIMRRAIDLAMRGRGAVEPNPTVGCVIVKDGREIGAGWHERYGQPHAEPNALAACTEPSRGATAYVTLEPCCHQQKQTPPCVPRLIDPGIRRVVIGCVDPNPTVCGKGIQQLRDAGIEVQVGVLQAECCQLIAPFFVRMVLKRPYVTAKWAQTADGKVAGPDGARLQISGPAANTVVHALRARCDAILVGVNTVLNDDPLLTTRGVANARPLRRLVLDRALRTPLRSRLVQTVAEAPLTVYCDPSAAMDSESLLRAVGVDVVRCSDVAEIFRREAAGGCTHLLVEPGPTLARGLFDAGVLDRLWVFGSSRVLGGSAATAAAAIPTAFHSVGSVQLGDDTLTESLNSSGDAYFAAVPSADFVLSGSRGER